MRKLPVRGMNWMPAPHDRYSSARNDTQIAVIGTRWVGCCRPLLRFVILLLVAIESTTASSITSGTFNSVFSDVSPYWFLNLQGPGFQLKADALNPAGPYPKVDFCTGTCVATFSGPLASEPLRASLLLDGITYDLQGHYVVDFLLTFVGNPQSATAVCDCTPGHSPFYSTVWPVSTFTMTGTVRVRSLDSSATILTLDVAGAGFATAESQFIPGTVGNGTNTIFTFTPEPSMLVMLGIGFVLISIIQSRRPHADGRLPHHKDG